MTKDEFVHELRGLAEYLESRDFDFTDCRVSSHLVYLMCPDKDRFLHNVRCLGSFAKSADSYLNATHQVGKQFAFQITARREEVCEKIQVGTKLVPATARQVIEAEPAHEEPVFEYRCPERWIDHQEDGG